MSVIEIHGLTKDYGENKGVFDVSFKVDKGEVFGFLGPNGAGKTTTIRHLLGFIVPAKHVCLIEGYDCSYESSIVTKQLGYIPGEINLMDDITGIQFIRFMAEYRGMKGLGRTRELLDRFDLDARCKIKKMSKGMKQKLGIVVAFMHDPDVLILDEPTSGLDPLMQMEFVKLIKEEKKRGKTILMSSHIFEEIEKTCDRVGIIKKGRIIAIEQIEALKKSKQKVYDVTFINNEEAIRFTKHNLNIKEVKDNVVSVIVKNDLKFFISCLNQHEVLSLDIVNQSLEEVFMQYYGGASYD